MSVTGEQVAAGTAVAQGDLAALCSFAAAHAPLCVLTGAGLSAASGIPTYRDAAGHWQRSPPILATQFLRSEHARRRYWLRSLFGWPAFAAAQPNAGHRALVALAQSGFVSSVVTQNVDGLHQRAGTKELVQLHGCLDEVACLQCAATYPRGDIQSRLETMNHALAARGRTVLLLADGDAELPGSEADSVLQTLRVPNCTLCGGVLKPCVVFFGDSIPPAVWAAADSALERARGLLLVGSSIGVYSALRVCRRAHGMGLPIVAVNRGWTRADGLIRFKVEADAATTLAALHAAQTVKVHTG